MISKEPKVAAFSEAQLCVDLRVLKKARLIVAQHPEFRAESHTGQFLRETWRGLQEMALRLAEQLDG